MKNLNVGLIRDIRLEARNVTNMYLKVVGRKDVSKERRLVDGKVVGWMGT